MKSIIFNQHQVNHALKNEEGMFRVVVKPYPILSADKSYWEFKGIRWAGENSSYAKKFGDNARPEISELAPFQIRETIFVKEKFVKSIFGKPIYFDEDFRWFQGKEKSVKWKSPVHMKQEHSRLTLQIKSIGVERLADISEEGAEREGSRPAFTRTTRPNYPVMSQPRYDWGFEELWDSTHKKPEEKWEASPWVFAYSYEVIKND